MWESPTLADSVPYPFEDEPEITRCIVWKDVHVVPDVEGARSLSLPRAQQNPRLADKPGNSHSLALISMPVNAVSSFPTRTYRPPPVWLLGQVAWEVTELASWVEMYELDRRFVLEKDGYKVHLRHHLLDGMAYFLGRAIGLRLERHPLCRIYGPKVLVIGRPAWRPSGYSSSDGPYSLTHGGTPRSTRKLIRKE